MFSFPDNLAILLKIHTFTLEEKKLQPTFENIACHTHFLADNSSFFSNALSIKFKMSTVTSTRGFRVAANH